MKTVLIRALMAITAAVSIPPVVAPPSGSAAALHVNSSGSDGYIQAPYVFPGIQAAVDAADPGDTVVVPNGTYTENVTIEKPLTVVSQNGPAVTTVIAATPNESVFTITAKNVTLSGFTAYGATYWSLTAGVELSSGSGNCTITNNRFGISPAHQNGCGIFIYESGGHTISQNDCRYNQYDGIDATKSDNNIIDANDCSYNDDEGISFSNSHGNLFSGNESRYNGKSGIALWNSTDNIVTQNQSQYNWIGISLRGSASLPASGNLLLRNVLNDNDLDGIYIVGGTGNLLIMNTTQMNGEIGININQVSGNRCWLNNLLSNPFYQVRPGGTSNQWVSPALVWYIHNGVMRTQLLGNHYDDHDLSDSHGDGVADSAYDLHSDGDPAYDWFPLAAPSTDPAWDWDVTSDFEKIISSGSDVQVLSTLTIVAGRVTISGAVLTIGL